MRMSLSIHWTATAAVMTLVVGCGSGRNDADPTDSEPADALAVSYPERRGYADLHFHDPSGDMILFGGEANRRASLLDLWAYDVETNTWQELTPETGPDEGSGSASAYDRESDRIIFYFTTQLDASAPRGLGRISETWAIDVATGTWTNMNPDPAPFGLMGARAVYNSAADRIVLFGGADFTTEESPRFNETWSYDYNSNTWTQMDATNAPPGRSYFGMAYDEAADKTLIFGGSFAEADHDRAAEMWEYDYGANAWSQIEYSGDVPSDHHPFMVYAAELDETLYLVNQDFWGFDYASKVWNRRSFDDGLGVRHFHAMAYDRAAQRLVVFGGGPRGLRYDNATWVYDPTADTWALAGPRGR